MSTLFSNLYMLLTRIHNAQTHRLPIPASWHGYMWGPHMVYHHGAIYILYLYDQMWLVGKL